ncbi:hypothetical protein JHK85_048945 [Glycine max]|nr:hypothetical protein JHK85_048945 [Glycine max]
MDGTAEHSPSSFVVEKEKLELTLVPPFSFGLGGQHSNEIIDLFDNDFRSCDDVIEGSSTDSKLQWCKMKLSSYLALDFCTLVSSEYDVFPLAWVASVDKVRKTNVVIEEMISSIQEINEKLVPLQEKLLVKSSILEDAQKSKVELNCRLVSTANSITSLVEEIEL